MWSRQLRHSMAIACLSAAKSAMGRGKPMAIDRLITLGQDEVNFAWYLFQLLHCLMFQLVEGYVVVR
jgi:hypothetical protein